MRTASQQLVLISNIAQKSAGKTNILARESGDSPWKRDMKLRQNQFQALLSVASFHEKHQKQCNHQKCRKHLKQLANAGNSGRNGNIGIARRIPGHLATCRRGHPERVLDRCDAEEEAVEE